MNDNYSRVAPEIRDSETYTIIGSLIDVNKELGRGFLESAYNDALEEEFKLRGVPFAREVQLPIFYKSIELRTKYRADFVCYGRVIVEIKAIKALTDLERAQVLHYLKATRFEKAILANFGSPTLEYERIVNTLRR